MEERAEECFVEEPKVKTGFWHYLFFGNKIGAEPFEWPFRGCKHKWELLDKTFLESAYEQMDKSDFHPNETPPIYYFRKKVIIHFHCTKCGRMKSAWDAVNPSPEDCP